MKEITVQDCVELKEKFDRYCETAEQHQFPLLMVAGLKLNATVDAIVAAGVVENQKDKRAMFQVILKILGEDATEYQEEEEAAW